MSEEQFVKAYNVPPKTEKDWESFLADKKAVFQFLKNVYRADAESMLEKKIFPGEDTPRYDLYQEGVKPADVATKFVAEAGEEKLLFTSFEEILRKELQKSGKPINRELIIDAIPEEVTERLITAGYDMDKIIDFEISTYNKYRGSWFSAVFGDVQLLLAEMPDDDVKEEFTRKIKVLLTKNRMIYGISLDEAADEQEAEAMKAERGEFIKDVDVFLDELINYCDAKKG